MAAATETNTTQIPPPPLLPSPSSDPIIPLNFPIATKLNANNYLTWKSQIQPIIHGFNLTRFLDGPAPEKTIRTDAGQIQINPAFHPWDLQDQLLLGWIRSSLTEGIQGQVANCATAGEIWSTLRQIYSATSRARLTDLRRQLQTTTKGTSSCTDYLQTMRHIADELAFCGSPISDEDLVMAVLNGLGPEFDSFVISVTTASRHSPFTFPDLHTYLLSHESRLQGQNSHNGILPSQSNPSAFVVKTNNSYQNRSNTSKTRTNNNTYRSPNQYQPRPSNPPGFNIPTCYPHPPTPNQQRPPYSPQHQPQFQPNFKAPFNQPRPNQKSNPNTQCQICAKFGHVAKECYFRYKNDPSYKGRPSTYHAYVANPSSSSSITSPTEWVLDSGATNHVTHDFTTSLLSLHMMVKTLSKLAMDHLTKTTFLQVPCTNGLFSFSHPCSPPPQAHLGIRVSADTARSPWPSFLFYYFTFTTNLFFTL